jgi:hypothetical protein
LDASPPAGQPAAPIQHAPLPNGFNLPAGLPIKGIEMQRVPMFAPELEAELRKARDQSDGRYLIVVYRADANGDLHQHMQRGSKWDDEAAFLKAYRLFLADFLRVTPEMLSRFVQQPAPSIPEPPVPLPDEAAPVVKAAPKKKASKKR